MIIDHMSVQISPSLTDLDNIEGLCGRFDLKCGNDFLGGDGGEFPDTCDYIEEDCSNLNLCNSEHGRDHQDIFAQTWR